jgi:hypothetical protein
MIVYVNAESTVEVAQDGNEGCCAQRYGVLYLPSPDPTSHYY